MRVQTTTRKFEASHGRKPSGRGTWAFEVRAWDGSTTEVWASHSQTLSEARREVLSRFERGSVAELVVLP